MKMLAGTYYIGDLCYVLHDRWDEFCDLTIAGSEVLDGVFTFKDGTQFATFCTAYGDGVYRAQVPSYLECSGDRSLGVDAGLVGCVLVDKIKQGVDGNDVNMGITVTFTEDFEVSEHRGNIFFGDVVVPTNVSDEDDDYISENDYNDDY